MDKPDTHRVYLLTKPVAPKKSTAKEPEVIFQVGKSFTSIFKVQALNYGPGYETGAKEKEQIKELLSKSGCRLQFIKNRLPFDAEKFATAHAWDFNVDDDYLKWASDYVRRWFLRVGDFVYEEDLYLVVSEVENQQNKSLTARKTNFVKACQGIGNSLNALKMQAQQLNEQEGQDLICKNPIACFHKQDTQAKINQGLFKAGYITSLPDEITDNWLLFLATIRGVNAISVTIEPVDKLEKSEIKERIKAANKSLPAPLPADLQRIITGKEEPVKVSITYCASGNTAESTQATFEKIESIFDQLGARCSSGVDQSLLAQHCLPLGQSLTDGNHSISSSTAAMCLPIVRVKNTKNLGTPLGTTLASSEPVYLAMNAQGMDDLLVVAAEEKQRSALLSLLSLRYLTTGNKVIYVGAGRSLELPIQCLAANAHKISLTPAMDLHSISLPGRARLAFFGLQDVVKLQDSHIAMLRHALDTMEEKTVLMIETGSVFSEAEELLSLINYAKDRGKSVILADSASSLIEMSIPTKNFKNILAFGPGQEENEIYQSITGIHELHLLNFGCAYDTTLLFANYSGNCDILHLITSPMEACMLQFSHKPSQEKEFEKKLSAMIENIRERNPKLSESDAVRQGVYYMGLEV